MHVAPNAMADQRAHDRKAVLGLDVMLDRVTDVADVVAGHTLRHRQVQRLLGDGQQLLRDRRDRADREGARGVCHPAVLDDADVDRQDVPALERVGAGDPVHHH